MFERLIVNEYYYYVRVLNLVHPILERPSCILQIVKIPRGFRVNILNS